MRTIAVKIAWSLGLILAVIVLNFTLIQLAPGDAAVVLAGESGAGDPEVLAEIRADYGLDDPFISNSAVTSARSPPVTSATRSSSINPSPNSSALGCGRPICWWAPR